MSNKTDLTRHLKGIEYATERLEFIARKLRFSSLLLIFSTSINILVVFTLMFYISRLGSKFTFFDPSMFPTASIIITLIIIFLALIFDISKKNGNAFFEELSDELHKRKISEKNESYKNNSSLMTRVIMRQFTNNMSLPLFPGPYGPTILVVTNLLLTTLSFWVILAFNQSF